MKFDIICADPPYESKDQLTMSSVKRGAASNYNGVLSVDDIKNLDVEEISAPNSLLALWVPSFILPEGLEIMKKWGFVYKQNFIWVKTKKDPLANIRKDFKREVFKTYKKLISESKEFSAINLTTFYNFIKDDLIPKMEYDLNDGLQCKMGRIFRQTHEVCLIGVKGNMYDKLENRSQISVHTYPPMKHSAKPEGLQDRLDIMFQDKKLKRIELFARRQRDNYICIGNENKMTEGEDVIVSIEKLKKLKVKDYNNLLELANNEIEMAEIWKKL